MNITIYISALYVSGFVSLSWWRLHSAQVDEDSKVIPVLLEKS